MSLGMVPVKVGGDSRASYEPWATSLKQGMQAFMATLWAATTHQTPPLTKSVEILTNQYLPNSLTRKGRGERKSRTNVWFGAGNKLHNLTRLERTARVIQETLYVALRHISHQADRPLPTVKQSCQFVVLRLHFEWLVFFWVTQFD